MKKLNLDNLIIDSIVPITESKAQPLLQIDKHEMDEVLAEWFYRLPKGYAEEPYSDADLQVLEQCIYEFRNGGFKPVIAEAGPTTKKSKSNRDAIINSITETILASGISVTAVNQMTSHLEGMSDSDLTELYTKRFRKYTLTQFIGKAWTYFQDFFPYKGTKVGTGRGELMAIMAIKGSASGGTGEKDLKLDDGAVWEIKEGPDTIRMAKSGFAGLFGYVDEIKQFYKYLEVIGVNDSKNDKALLKKLQEAFNDDTLARDVFNTLTNNFRGDGFKATKEDKSDPDYVPITAENFFYRIKVAAEIPAGAIQLQYDGFEQLKSVKSDLLSNSDLLKNAKMLIKNKDGESEYWISNAEADQLKNAKVDAKVTIKKGAPASSKDFKVFMFNLINIFNHPYVKTPSSISKSFTDRKNAYFSEDDMKGILWYFNNKAEPHLGLADDFVVYGISQNMGKLARREKFAGKGYAWIDNQ
jgi:hypothetical protein